MSHGRHSGPVARRAGQGAVFVEYLQVVLFVTLVLAVATMPLGVMLVRYWDVIDVLIGLPFP